MNEIVFRKSDGFIDGGSDDIVEEWIITEDTRHGISGFRIQRYLNGLKKSEEFKSLLVSQVLKDYHQYRIDEYLAEPNTMFWDEANMFFASINDAYKAFVSGNLDKGRKAF